MGQRCVWRGWFLVAGALLAVAGAAWAADQPGGRVGVVVEVDVEHGDPRGTVVHTRRCQRAVGGRRGAMSTRQMVPLPGGDMLAASTVGDHGYGQDLLWRLGRDGEAIAMVPLPAGVSRLGGGASSGARAYISSDGGLITVDSGKAEVESFLLPSPGSAMFMCGPTALGSVATSVVTDAAGNSWLYDRWGGVLMIRGGQPHRTDMANGRKLDRAYPWVSTVGNARGVRAATGDGSEAGLWMYATVNEKKRRLLRAAAGERGFGTYCPADVVLSEEGGLPYLANAMMDADALGRVWLGGDGAARFEVWAVSSGKMTDVSPPAPLLRGGKVRQMVADRAGGNLYLATESAGVLVFDGAHWQGHAVNESLPGAGGGALEPVDALLVRSGGDLWIASGRYLLQWQDGD
jgi:hypothetical protein